MKYLLIISLYLLSSCKTTQQVPTKPPSKGYIGARIVAVDKDGKKVTTKTSAIK